MTDALLTGPNILLREPRGNQNVEDHIGDKNLRLWQLLFSYLLQ
jgi:hypothetical protein